jgi:hypothetical protein
MVALTLLRDEEVVGSIPSPTAVWGFQNVAQAAEQRWSATFTGQA